MNRQLVFGIATAGLMASTVAGIAQETTSIRSELDNVAARLAKLEKGSEQSVSWIDKITIKGDIRYRYEYKDKDGDTDKSRNRLRARIGAYAQVNDETMAGIRLATGSDESPTSTNQDIDNFGSKKPIWLDLAYIAYAPKYFDGATLTLGKMKQPWVLASDLLFDSDFNPEGVGLTYGTDLGAISLNTQMGYFTLMENNTDDIRLVTAQMSASADMAEDVMLTATLGGFFYGGLKGEAFADFDGNSSNGKTAQNGNSNNGSGAYLFDYDIIDGSLVLDIHSITAYAEVANNIADDVEDDTAWILGLGTQIKKLSLDYNYRDMERDSVLGALADGDFGGPGGKGHKIKASYPVAENLSIGAAYFRIETASDADVNLVHFDVDVKF